MTHKSSVSGLSYRLLVAVALLMVILATVDQALHIRFVLGAFIFYQGPGGPSAVLSDDGEGIQSVKSAIFCIQSLLGDGFLVCALPEYLSETDISSGIPMLVGVPEEVVWYHSPWGLILVQHWYFLAYSDCVS